MKIQNIKDALSIFRNAATKQGEATEEGNYKLGNKNYKIIVEVATYLKNENKIDELLIFLEDESITVKLWAAFYLLETHEIEAVNVLKIISRNGGIHSLTAETTLGEWKKGNLF